VKINKTANALAVDLDPTLEFPYINQFQFHVYILRQPMIAVANDDRRNELVEFIHQTSLDCLSRQVGTTNDQVPIRS